LVGMMLQKAFDACDISPKEVAAATNYSVDAIYAAMLDKRRIPKDGRKTISDIHSLGGLAVALQETGYQCFAYIDGDRHPQTMLQRYFKEDAEADAAGRDLPLLLIDVRGPEGVTAEKAAKIKLFAKEVIDEIRAGFNLLAEIESQYKINITDLLKEKSHR
jgi:hypothetical protein